MSSVSFPSQHRGDGADHLYPSLETNTSSRARRVWLRPPYVPGASAAGDGFAAGLMYGLTRSLPLPAALQCGAYVAWRTLQIPGTVDPALADFLPLPLPAPS